MKRQSLSKRTRFEVYKRDSFQCQYCGASAPDVVLEVDHIVAVANGGTNDMTNLVTACRSCNSGKSAVPLADDAAVKKSKRQLDELNARREQIEMMAEWNKALLDLEAMRVSTITDHFHRVTAWSLTESGRQSCRKWLRTFELSEILEAITAGAANYLRPGDDDGKPTRESAQRLLDHIPGICHVRRREKETPWVRDYYHVRNILRKRLGKPMTNFVDHDLETIAEAAHEIGFPVEKLRGIAAAACSWRDFISSAWRGIYRWESEQ